MAPTLLPFFRSCTFPCWPHGPHGVAELDSELIKLIGHASSDCDVGLKKADIPLPTFIVDSNGSNTLRFFKKACKAKEEYLYNGFARVFRQQPKPGESYINDQSCSEVWHSTADDAAKMGRDVMIEKMVAFVEDYKRWAAEGNGCIRKTQRPEDLGMIKTEIAIDGLKRYWYTFEPTAYKRGLRDKYPLVIAIHGFSCSGEYFAENSGWHHVGEERGAIIVYPTAYPFNRSMAEAGLAPISRPRRPGIPVCSHSTPIPRDPMRSASSNRCLP